jgi:hypothetical protein
MILELAELKVLQLQSPTTGDPNPNLRHTWCTTCIPSNQKQKVPPTVYIGVDRGNSFPGVRTLMVEHRPNLVMHTASVNNRTGSDTDAAAPRLTEQNP